MKLFETTLLTEKYREPCEDRVAVLGDNQRTVIVVADGAGGIGAGDEAADTVVREVSASYRSVNSATDWSNLLRQIDSRVSSGESTAVVIDIRSYGIAGASVGDSQAWIISEDSVFDLTKEQNRKPLLGSGSACPVSFTHSPLTGVLVVATDGFFNYAKFDEVVSLVGQTPFFEIPRRCIDLVRLPSGELWDDVGIVAVRKKRKRASRQVYEI